MSKNNNIYSNIITFLATLRVLTERFKCNKNACKVVRNALMCLLALLVIIAYTLVICRVQAKKDEAMYQAQLEQYRLEMVFKGASDAAEKLQDPQVVQLKADAEELAKVLYGVRDNSSDDMRTYAWCVLNRVDNPSFPNTLEEVVEQKSQWIRYSNENPVLEEYYQIALEILGVWHDGHRPVSSDYVFVNWTDNDIVLRDNWAEGSGTHYWRWNK